MYTKYNHNKKFIYKILLIVFLAISSILLVLFVLEKKGIINIYSRKTSNSPQIYATDENGNRLPNTVDYGPPKLEDNTVIPDKNTKKATSENVKNDLSAVITNSRKSGDYFLIKAVILGSTDARCAVRMSRDSYVAKAESTAKDIGGQYSCDNLRIPLTELPINGEWDISLTITDQSGATFTTSQKVIL